MDFSDSAQNIQSVQSIQSVAGAVPAVGTITDHPSSQTADTGWKSAAQNAAAAVPVVGDTSLFAGQAGQQAGSKAQAPAYAVDVVIQLSVMLSASSGKVKTGAAGVSGQPVSRQALEQEKNDEKELCLNGRCFTGDTLIYTKNGYRLIKEIKKGDEVYSRNEKTGEIGLRKVEEVFQTTAHTIYHVWLDDREELKMTAYHPLFIEGRGWVNAINLQEYDTVVTMDGAARITKIIKERHDQAVSVYNFHVEGWAAYFVSAFRIYVHNGNERHIEDKFEIKKFLPSDRKIVRKLKGINYKLVRAIPAKTANKRFVKERSKPGSKYWPPYKRNTRVYELKLKQDTTFLRLYNSDPTKSGKLGNWLTFPDELDGVTPEELKDKFALPFLPDRICEVVVPAGTHIQVSYAGKIQIFGNGNGIQVDLMGKRIDAGAFKDEQVL